MNTVDLFVRVARKIAAPASPGADDIASTIAEVCDAAYRRGGLPRLLAVGILEWLDLLRHRLAVGFGIRFPVVAASQPDGAPFPSRSQFMIVDDLRHALRRLRSQPASALLAATMLALAIGLSSAMFTVFDALILSPAPFRDPDTLAWLAVGRDDTGFNVNLRRPLVQAWRSNPGFKGLYAIRQETAQFGTGEEAETMAGARITPGLMDDLGVRPLLGRTFIQGEGRPDSSEGVMLAETTWRSRYGADPEIVGKRVQISGASLLVVGVLPASFRFPFFRTAVWRPLDLDNPAERPNALLYAYARLSTDVPKEDTLRIAGDIVQQTEPDPAGRTVSMRPIGARYLDVYSAGTVKVLAAGVSLVFLVLCVNVTNLMLARLSARRREFALCSALGASRARLLSQAVWEQVTIGVFAIPVGLAVAFSLVAIARAYLPASIVGATLNPVDIDLRAIAAMSAFGGLAVIIAGVLPAWMGTRADAARHGHTAARSTTPERRTRRLTTALVVTEVALAIALSVAAGIQLRSFVNLIRDDRGFDADRQIAFRVTAKAGSFTDDASRYTYAEALRQSVASLPGIDGATMSSGAPPGSAALHFYDVVTDVPGAPPVPAVMNAYDVTPEFFSVLGIRLLEGRTFQAGDAADATIVARSLAAKLWPGEPAVGRTMRFMKRSFRIIGVTGDILNRSNDPRLDEPEIYLPLLAAPPAGSSTPALAASSMYLIVRCRESCPPLETLRAGIQAAGARSTVGRGTRIADEYWSGLERPRSAAVVAVAFAAIGLLAVGGGLFAVLTRVVQQRQREFGIRVALGATPGDLRRLVFNNGLFVLGGGLAAGVAVAWLFSRVLASIQYQVEVGDVSTWALVLVVISLMVLAASWRPARRAARVDPVGLLREE